MAIEKKERYIVVMRIENNGAEFVIRKNVLAGTFRECLEMYGEENIVMVSKLGYEEGVKK